MKASPFAFRFSLFNIASEAKQSVCPSAFFLFLLQIQIPANDE
jgi:hypothetical protein